MQNLQVPQYKKESVEYCERFKRPFWYHSHGYETLEDDLLITKDCNGPNSKTFQRSASSSVKLMKTVSVEAFWHYSLLVINKIILQSSVSLCLSGVLCLAQETKSWLAWPVPGTYVGTKRWEKNSKLFLHCSPEPGEIQEYWEGREGNGPQTDTGHSSRRRTKIFFLRLAGHTCMVIGFFAAEASKGSAHPMLCTPWLGVSSC